VSFILTSSSFTTDIPKVGKYTKENETLHKFVYKQRNELAKQTKTEKELESKLKQKEKEICDLKKKMESILVVTESIVIKTEIELSNFSKFQNEKLIRK
jgi:molecular chaperone GrpE (heat shock protein)